MQSKIACRQFLQQCAAGVAALSVGPWIAGPSHAAAARRKPNIVLIVSNDHGIAFPGAKTTLYEPGMNLPCIVRTPWQENQGIACDAPVYE